MSDLIRPGRVRLRAAAVKRSRAFNKPARAIPARKYLSVGKPREIINFMLEAG